MNELFQQYFSYFKYINDRRASSNQPINWRFTCDQLKYMLTVSMCAPTQVYHTRLTCVTMVDPGLAVTTRNAWLGRAREYILDVL